MSADRGLDSEAAGWLRVETSLGRHRGAQEADQRVTRGRTDSAQGVTVGWTEGPTQLQSLGMFTANDLRVAGMEDLSSFLKK